MDRVVEWLRKPWLQLVLVLLVATVFRVCALDTIPPGLFGDEAAEGLDALDVLAGRGQVFFPTNYGREGLYIWLVAGSIGLFGVNPIATRLPAVLLGIATCGLAWWMAREMARSLDGDGRPLTAGEKVQASAVVDFLPLMVGLFLATAFWHVLFSRFSQRTILTPFAIALCIAAFWRGINTARIGWFALAGVGMGLGLHSYSVGRFFPVFMALFLVLQWFTGRRAGRPILTAHWRGVLVMYVVAAIVFAPLGYYFITHPGSFFQRASAVATYAGASFTDTAWAIADAGLATAMQYFVPNAGDRALFHNLQGRPVFEPVTALLAVLGLVVCLFRWRQPVPLFLLLWLGVMSLPGALATDRYPTLPRVLGVLPGLYLFPAVGLLSIATLLRRRRQWGRRLAVVVAAASIAVAAVFTYRDYFVRWGPWYGTFDAFEGDMTTAVSWMAEQQPSDHIYLSADIYRHPTYMYLAEWVTVTGYFEHANPNLSWFDARFALPLPPDGSAATYLIGASASPDGPGKEWLERYAEQVDRRPDPAGQPALTVLRSASVQSLEPTAARYAPLYKKDRVLSLVRMEWSTGSGGRPLLVLTWCTEGPVAEDWGGYRLRVTAGERSVDLPFDAFRAPEWVPGGQFITWHTIDWPDRPSGLTFSVE